MEAPTDSLSDLRAYYTVFVEEGRQPNQSDPSGYGFGAPVRVWTADSVRVDPYDRVALTGRMFARPDVTDPEAMACSLTADAIAVVQRASPSWADEMDARRAALQARSDSRRAVLEERAASHDRTRADSAE